MAVVLVTIALWAGRWLSLGGPSRSKAAPGQIAFISDRSGGDSDIWLMNEDGSEAHRLAVLPGQEREAVFSPDAEWIYFTAEFGTEELQLGRMRPNGRSAGKFLATKESQSSVSVSKGGRALAFISNSQVFICDINGGSPDKRLPSHADESLQIPDLAGSASDAPPTRRYSMALLSPKANWLAAASLGADTQHAYISLGPDKVTATLLDTTGQPISSEECTFSWSPDGKQLALAANGAVSGALLAIYAPTESVQVDIVPMFAPSMVLLESRKDAFGLRHPAWAVDGRTIAFEKLKSLPDGSREPDGIWTVSTSGGSPKQIIRGDAQAPLFSPDGRFLLYQAGPDLLRYDLKSGKVLNLTKGQGLNRYPTWSPVLSGK